MLKETDGMMYKRLEPYSNKLTSLQIASVNYRTPQPGYLTHGKTK